jgi:hypothetical protein
MNLESKTPSQLEQLIAEARKAEQTAKAALLRDGRAVFAADEHDRRAQAIETERGQAIAVVKSEVQRRIQEIDEQLLPTDIDPVTSLKGDDLTRAAAIAGFVKEDIERGNVAAKLRAVLRSGDKAAQAVWLRYLALPGERGIPRWDDEVQDLMTRLEAIVRPADRRQDALRERQTELSKVVMGEAVTNFLQTKYGSQVIRTGRS